jgi:hypothetical protein
MSERPHRGPGANAGTQRERILAELRRRREVSDADWISGRDFRAPTCDGGPEIYNITPRISELRARHPILTERGPGGVACYRLAWDLGGHGAPAEPPAAASATWSTDDVDEPPAEQLALELGEPDPAPAAPLNAALIDWDAAA